MRECVNCKHSRGLGSDVWCGKGHKEYTTYMIETDCPYFEEMDYKNDSEKENEKIINDNDYSYKVEWKSAVAKIETLEGELSFLKDELKGFEEENEELRKKIEILQWDLEKTCEDLDYFANLKVTAMKGCEPEKDKR